MRRFTMVLLAATAATMAAGCGGLDERGRDRSAPDAGQFTVVMRADALPEGHPPVDGYGNGLPPGHPVCPAGRQMLERGTDGAGGTDDEAPQVISI